MTSGSEGNIKLISTFFEPPPKEVWASLREAYLKAYSPSPDIFASPETDPRSNFFKWATVITSPEAKLDLCHENHVDRYFARDLGTMAIGLHHVTHGIFSSQIFETEMIETEMIETEDSYQNRLEKVNVLIRDFFPSSKRGTGVSSSGNAFFDFSKYAIESQNYSYMVKIFVIHILTDIIPWSSWCALLNAQEWVENINSDMKFSDSLSKFEIARTLDNPTALTLFKNYKNYITTKNKLPFAIKSDQCKILFPLFSDLLNLANVRTFGIKTTGEISDSNTGKNARPTKGESGCIRLLINGEITATDYVRLRKSENSAQESKNNNFASALSRIRTFFSKEFKCDDVICTAIGDKAMLNQSYKIVPID